VTAHINKYRQTADELTNNGAPVTEIQLKEIIATTLPPFYHAAVAAWETLPRDANRNITQLTARMLLEETKKSGGIPNTTMLHSSLHIQAYNAKLLQKKN
jgi:hypothetical protein